METAYKKVKKCRSKMPRKALPKRQKTTEFKSERPISDKLVAKEINIRTFLYDNLTVIQTFKMILHGKFQNLKIPEFFKF